MYSQEIQEIINQLKFIVEGINNPWVMWVPLFGVLAALFLGAGGGDWMKSWFKKPKLNISIKVASPDCHKTSFYRSGVDRKVCDTYYFRFRIENSGNSYAENVEAMVTDVYKKRDGQYEKVTSFLPLNLVWSHYLQLTMPKIQPKLFKHLDFGHILKQEPAYLERFNISEEPNVIFELDVAVRPNTGSHILLPGDYKVKIVFAGNNVDPVEKTYHLIINDVWDDDENRMLQNNVLIEEINVSKS